MGGKGMTRATLGGTGEEVTSVESQSSGLSGGRRVPRKLRAAPLCQAASVRASQGDWIAEKLLWSHSSGRNRGLYGAQGAEGVPAPGSWALGHRPNAAQGWAERGTSPCAGLARPHHGHREHTHTAMTAHTGSAAETRLHTHVRAHTRGGAHTHGDMHVDVRTNVDVDMHVDVCTLTGMCAWTCTHTHRDRHVDVRTLTGTCVRPTHTRGLESQQAWFMPALC